jgi:hypothetical protein
MEFNFHLTPRHIATAFYFGPGGQVTIFDEEYDEVGQWHLEQYVEVLNEN